MERLDFVLPDFTRLAWSSDKARETWEPRVRAVARAWMEIEWRSIPMGVRRCAIRTAAPEQLVDCGARWAEEGLTALPLQMEGLPNGPYASTSRPWEPGQPFAFRLVLGAVEDVARFRHAWEEGDDQAIGHFLGYPDCCLSFFRETWVDRGLVDATWAMAIGKRDPDPAVTSLSIDGPPVANILGRWLGVRAVPHLPCSVDCPETIRLGERMLEVGERAGFGQEMAWLLDILSWPFEWSALHGIAEIRTPVVKVVTRTDATARKYVVRRRGSIVPDDAGVGVAFPYRRPKSLKVLDSRGFRDGLDNPILPVREQGTSYAQHNGFWAAEQMNSAHAPIVALASEVLDGVLGNVLDLGCGNGALLAKIQEARPGIVPFGIERDADRYEGVRRLFPELAANVTHGDMFGTDDPWSNERRYALALVMPGRFLEVDHDRAWRLRARLEERCDRILLYAYEDILDAWGGLPALARRAGFSLLHPSAERGVGMALVASDPRSRSDELTV